MSLLQCFGLKPRSKKAGGLSADDLRKMLTTARRRNVELKQEIQRIEFELEMLSEPVSSSSSAQRFCGWVEFLRSDQPKVWHPAWAVLEDGRLKFYREENTRSVMLEDVDVNSHQWKLHFREGAYSTESHAVPQFDLNNIIVLNVLDKKNRDGFYHLYFNTGSEESKIAWKQALEQEMCRRR